MVDQARARRLAKRISQIVASALEHEVKDPRLTMVTITDTRVTGDLRDATVYYTVLGETVDDEPGHRRRRGRAGQRDRGAALQGRRRHRRPLHPDAGVRAGRRARRGAPDGGAARPHAGVGRGGGPARGRRPPRGRSRPVPRTARGGRRRVTALVGAGAAANPEAPSPGDDATLEGDIGRATAAAAAAAGRRAEDVTLLAHVRPDADALGSALALGIALYRRGVRVQVSFGAPGRVPETLRPLDVLGLCVPAAEVDAAPEVLVTCDVNEPARLGPLAGPAGHRRYHGDARPPRHQPGLRRRPDARPRAEATVVLVDRVPEGDGGGRRRRHRPVPLRRARHRHPRLPHGGRGRAPARRRADRGRRGPAHPGRDRSWTPTRSRGWRCWRSCCSGAELEPEAAGGLGLVHTVVPADHVARFRPEEVDGVVDTLRTAAEAEVAAVFKQVGPSGGGRSRCGRKRHGWTSPPRRRRSAAGGIHGRRG